MCKICKIYVYNMESNVYILNSIVDIRAVWSIGGNAEKYAEKCVWSDIGFAYRAGLKHQVYGQRRCVCVWE